MAKKRMIVWRGPSQLDGITPIVLLATYDTRAGDKSSQNAKTGGMIQTFVLRDDMSPMEALRAGADAAICGTCPHRSSMSGGSDACYVIVWQAPESTWQAYKRDGTRTNPRTGRPTRAGDSVAFDLSAFAGRKVRFGSYGDPAAVPLHVWQEIHAVASDVTGYTHAWSYSDAGYSAFCMASCDNVAEWQGAKAMGYRSFVVRPAGAPKPRGLVQCPASAEAGKKTTCAACLQCGGTSSGRRADISIAAHGATRKRFKSLPLSVV